MSLGSVVVIASPQCPSLASLQRVPRCLGLAQSGRRRLLALSPPIVGLSNGWSIGKEGLQCGDAVPFVGVAFEGACAT